MQPTLTPAPALVAALPLDAWHNPTLVWALPFFGMLLSMAIFPIVAERLWHRRIGVVAFAWSASLLLAESNTFGLAHAAFTAWHALLLDYLSFVTLLLALYTAGGGVLLIGGPGGTALGNTALLALGIVGATWAPEAEVANLFAALFITITPVVAMLQAGTAGALAPLLRLTLDSAGQPSPAMYFWLSGGLAAILDNAPTYLVFFQQAGGDAQALTQPPSTVLRAISAGAVFFGGLTYVGNAPNMMVRAIASRRGVRMPGFFVYIAYAAALLLPIFALQTLLFFR